MQSEEGRDRLRGLPSVDRLAGAVSGAVPKAEAISAARAVLDQRRGELLAGASDVPDLAARLRERLQPSLRRVLNATGVLIHTNLGRAPLAPAAVDALLATASGYTNLELDLASGSRGSRGGHVRDLLTELTDAEDAFVVNNGAAAVLLAVAALASEHGRPVIVSRGQLIEIGGGFRIPEVLAQTGTPMVEVGTTNRTRLSDYTNAVERFPDSVILRVHQSNFRTVGFVEDVAIEPLCAIGPAVIDDVGSGALADGVGHAAEEPSIRRSIAAGAAVVCFSGDKLLGGPQAGVLVGRGAAIAACSRHPLARALRIGRLPLAALASTLALYRDPERAIREIPVLAMLAVTPEVLAARAESLARATGGTVVDAVARVGGGALPMLELRGAAVRLDHAAPSATALAARLRAGDPPLVGRIVDDAVLLDPRTLTDDEIELAARVVKATAGARQTIKEAT